MQTYSQLIASLDATKTVQTMDGLPIQHRNCPDRKSGYLDPRFQYAADLTPEDAAKDSLFSMNGVHLFGPSDVSPDDHLAFMRKQFGWRSLPVDANVTETTHAVPTPWGNMSLLQYEPTGGGHDRPCLYYIHGGGFFAGDVETFHHHCRHIAQLSGAVVCTPDYPLSPEFPFPAGLESCWAGLTWLHGHAQELGIHPEKFLVAGDSAGGNLSLNCALKGRDLGCHWIRHAFLLYPVICRRGTTGDAYDFWREEQFYNPENSQQIKDNIRFVGELSPLMEGWYFGNSTAPDAPYTDGMAHGLAGLPPVTIYTAEYDFLRPECEVFGRKLLQAGIPLTFIQYGGTTHGFFDRLGYYPQTDDIALQMVQTLKDLA